MGCVSVSKRDVLGSFPPRRCSVPDRSSPHCPHGCCMQASHASFCVARLLPAPGTLGDTLSTRNPPGASPASQYPREVVKRTCTRPPGAIPLGNSHGNTAVPSIPPRPPHALRDSSQGSAPTRDPPRSVPPVRAAALAPGARRCHPSPASAIPAALARAARLDGPARPRATRGPVARGRAGRRRRLRVRGPTASAILDAAAAAVSASSCVFAARCRFARPRRQRGHTRARGRKRKEEKGVESAGDRSLSTEIAAERGGEAAKAPAPAPPPPPTRPGGLRPVRCARPAAMPGPRRR